jgi:signal peptidase I
MRAGVALGLALAAAWLLARRSLDTVQVRGGSMTPALLPGDRLLVARSTPRLGDVVLARDQWDSGRELIKRVVAMDRAGIALAGDNLAASTSAIVEPAAVRWRVVLRYWPPNRFGRIDSRRPALVPVDEGGEPACTLPQALIVGP